MTTKTFNITALSPVLTYDPPQDVPNAVWKSDSGGITLGNLDSGNAGRVLMGTGTVTITAFGSGIGFAGSITGVYCSYSAALSPGPGNPLSSSSSSALPAAQTASPSTGMLASFTGLSIGNWELVLTGNCDNGSGIKVTRAVVEGWVGVTGANVSVNTLDDMDPSLNYSGVDWSTTRGLQAQFYDDTQHYTSSSKASMNYTFSGASGIIVWASVDNQHGPYAASLHYASSTYDSRNTLYSSGYNPFLAVPIPYLFVTGLNPTQSYTLVYQNKATNGTYLDLDYIQVLTADGGAPPDGGTAAVHALDDGGAGGGGLAGLGTGAVIGVAVGGGVVVVLLLGLIWWCWRRRKIKVDRAGGTRPLDTSSTPTGHHHHVIPLTMHGNNVLPMPFHPTMGSGSGSGYSQEHHAAERQGLLYGGLGGGGGYPSPPSTGMPMAYSPPSSSSGYDPYASFGGGYPSPHSSSNTPLGAVVPTDHVQARRQGKAAELDAARSLAAAMRIQNNNASVVMSPTTPGNPGGPNYGPGHPNYNPNNPNNHPNYGNTNTHSTITQSWDASSNGPSTPGPNSNSNPGGDVKLPDEPPPSYDPNG